MWIRVGYLGDFFGRVLKDGVMYINNMIIKIVFDDI